MSDDNHTAPAEPPRENLWRVEITLDGDTGAIGLSAPMGKPYLVHAMLQAGQRILETVLTQTSDAQKMRPPLITLPGARQ